MDSFNTKQRAEHLKSAERAVDGKDFGKAYFHTLQAAKFSVALAEQSTGNTRKVYAAEARALLNKALEFQKYSANGGKTENGKDEPEQAGKCRVERPTVRLDDVAGMESVKDQIRLRMIEPLKNPDEAKKHGLKMGGGILLYGPPGTGKTFLAKAVAGELDLPFYTISAADVFGKYVGESENNIRNLFQAARENPLSVIFIDELESIFRKRTENINETTQKVITVMLQELDGVRDDRNPFLLLGATNTPWLIDEAFMRTGRFDVKAYVGLPDEAARRLIIKNNFKHVEYPVEESAIEYLVTATDGFSGADIKGACEMIRQKAFVENRKSYSKELFESCAAEFKPAGNREVMEKIRQWEKENEIVRDNGK